MKKRKEAIAEVQAIPEEHRIFSEPFALAGFATLFIFIGSMYLAQSYPVIWRRAEVTAPKTVLLFFLMFVVALYLVTLIKRWTRRKSKIILGALITFGIYVLTTPFIFLAFVFLGSAVNGAFDSSSAQTFRTHVVTKWTSRARRVGRTWHLGVADWRVPNNVIPFKITKPEYETISIGTPVEIETKSGFFGYEWITSTRHLNKQP